MPCEIDVSFTPADYNALRDCDISSDVCVVFDVLRATSVMVTALANGAAGIIPVEEISEALELRRQHPGVLLAGERGGLRITAAQTGGVDFDLGNSPREFTADAIAGRTIVTTTTNGTRALQACASARTVIASSFLNLGATVKFVLAHPPGKLRLICAGTGDGSALEDVFAAGALCDALIGVLDSCEPTDAALVAWRAYRQSMNDLPASARSSLNGRRLYANCALRDDVEFCLRRDCFPLVPILGEDGVIRKSD